MKKNAMLKIAAILMVAVLLTTCAISSTFAKYTSTKTVDTTARVAVWGITVDTTLSGLFAEEYADKAGKAPNVKTLETGDLLVAPGTNESIDLSATVSGKSEVSVIVKNEVTFTFGDGWTYPYDAQGNLASQPETYMPIVFTINGTNYAMGSGSDSNTEYFTKLDGTDGLIAAINAAASTTATYAAGFDFDKEEKQEHDTSIAWAWGFESTDNPYVNDAKDTYLGKAAESKDITIKVTVKTTVTQSAAAGDAETVA